MARLPARPNLTPDRYRQVAVADVEFVPTADALKRHFLGREAYRRTRFIVARHGREVALVRVDKSSEANLFSPIERVVVLAGPAECVWLDRPEVDVGVPSQLARLAHEEAAGARCLIVKGLYEHVSFLLEPEPITLRVVEVVPPRPAKLVDQARRVLEMGEDLPPIVLEPQVIDLAGLAATHPADRYLFPCRGSGAAPAGGEVFYLDQRPERRDWVLVGCERSRQIHRHFYGDEPPYVEMCPRELAGAVAQPTLTKCCGLETGIERDGLMVVVPWGATLAEVRDGLRAVVASTEPRWALT